MKKKTMLSAILLLTVSVISYAQGTNQGDSILRNKHGRAILPKAGDIALGFNAVPVINFFLNSPNFLLSGSTNPNNASTVVQYTNSINNQITGKYFLDDKTAIRVRLGFNTLSGNVTNQVQDAQALYNAEQTSNANNIQAASTQMVTDKFQFSKDNITLQAGIEKRRGYGRLQGYYGAEFGVGFSKANAWETYGNNFSSQFPTTYTTDFSSGATTVQDPTTPGGSSTRNLDTTHTATWVFSLRAFIGVEYFFFPKISIGAEFGWAYAVSLNQGYSVDNETYYNGVSGPVDVVQTIDQGGQHIQHGFSIDNNNGQSSAISNSIGSDALTGASGSIILLFHF